jgi:hypothetical protein
MKRKNSRKGSPRRRREALVRIAAAAPDTASIESAIKGWIVPLLVKEFLVERGCCATEAEAKCGNPTSEPAGMEDVARRHIG